MQLDTVYEAFPTPHDCLRHLEKVLWDGKPKCPYCGSHKYTKIPNDRYRCNSCDKSYRITVKTLFEDSKCDLQKWFVAIITYRSWNKSVSVRGLALRIRVNKNTAFLMKKKLQDAYAENPAFFRRIADSITMVIDKMVFEKQAGI